MGIMDKAKFWKKEEEDIGDLSGLGDFGLDDEHGAEHPGMGNLPPPADMGDSGMHPDVPGMEEVPPTQGSRDMGDRLGLRPATPEQHAQSQQPMGRYYPQQARESPVMGDMAKDIEIIHAKLDAIRSSLDSINQRLATLERIATGENRSRYTW